MERPRRVLGVSTGTIRRETIWYHRECPQVCVGTRVGSFRRDRHRALSMEPTVFVLDDDSSMRKSIRWLVESIQFPVQEFGSAAEFLEEVDGHRAGCLLLDVRMPGMGGLELVERARRWGTK